ncbi:MAG TPA: RNA-binding cell elongation regulator Jag/EloR [Ktedonobacterales bacterium]|nr:RNA-binding cell elongation regulator Jag/EloR [Ktedonobacterales bacterium]HEX5158094.1 RNA-binding cell elongation regulator Jag/EloR [Ktedonobacterales bacterium]
MESVEASGKSIEDAIINALARLGRNRDEVEITVLQRPARGSRDASAREARVRATVLQQRPAVAPEVADPYFADDFEEFADDLAPDDHPPDGGGDADFPPVDELEQPEVTTDALSDVMAEDASMEDIAVAALYTILAHMGVHAGIEVHPAEGEEPLVLNIRGADERSSSALSVLIGRRGETLAALQLLMHLVVSKQGDTRERVIVDVEGYRHRREENLRTMAQRIAQQVRTSGRAVMLEAMPPNERRIVHMALADFEDISTESEGEGDQRRVVVSLKHSARR